ncbi:MAG: hypothetical protein ACKVQR_12360 [Aquabacterium sp.]
MRKLIMVAACAAALSTPALQAQQAAAAPPAAAASGPTVKPELAKPLQAVQAALAARNWAEAQAQLTEAEKVPDPGAYGLYVMSRFRAQAALGLNDLPAAAAALETAMASAFMPKADAVNMQSVLTRIRINLKQYPQAVTALARYAEIGGTDVELLRNRAHLQLLAGDADAADRTVRAEIDADRQAGKPPREQAVRLLAQVGNARKNDATYVLALELLAEFYPKPEYWEELADRTMRSPGFSDRLLIEVLRFKRAAGVLNRSDDYLDLAQLALTAGQPGEADKVMTDGYAAGQLGKGNSAADQARLRDQAARAATVDKASFADGERNAATARDGDVLINLGYAMAVDGQLARGAALVDQGLAKASLRRPDESRLRAGTVLWMAGRKDAALQAIAQVKAGDGSEALARLWSLYLRSPSSERKKPA